MLLRTGYYEIHDCPDMWGLEGVMPLDETDGTRREHGYGQNVHVRLSQRGQMVAVHQSNTHAGPDHTDLKTQMRRKMADVQMYPHTIAVFSDKSSQRHGFGHADERQRFQQARVLSQSLGQIRQVVVVSTGWKSTGVGKSSRAESVK